MTKNELLALIAEWESDLWEAQANNWGNSIAECIEVLQRLYVELERIEQE